MIGGSVAWRHIELVRELALQPTSKLILFALASRANDEGVCWPSMRKLCQDTGLARRTVQLHMGRLTEQGAVMREVRIGRVSGLRLKLQALRDVKSSTAHVQESPDCGQPVPEGRIRCIPPAHVVHPPAHQVHSSCARGAPEVKREDPMNIQKKNPSSAATVDNWPNASRPAEPPWWSTKAGVILQGVELGVSAHPGEDYRHYKDRLFKIWTESRARTRRSPRKSR